MDSFMLIQKFKDFQSDCNSIKIKCLCYIFEHGNIVFAVIALIITLTLCYAIISSYKYLISSPIIFSQRYIFNNDQYEFYNSLFSFSALLYGIGKSILYYVNKF